MSQGLLEFLQHLQSTVTSVTERHDKSCIRKGLLLGHCSRTFNHFFTRMQRKLGEDQLCQDRQAHVTGGRVFGQGRLNFPDSRDLRAS